MSNVYKIWQLLWNIWQKLIYWYSIPDIYFYQEDDGDDADGGKNPIISNYNLYLNLPKMI